MRSRDDAWPLLLLSPLGVSTSGFAEIIGPLSDVRPVMPHEFPGHGLAAPADPITIPRLAQRAVRALDRRNITRASLCGFGFGGMVALWIAAHHPDRTADLCVACSSAVPGNAAAYRLRAAEVRRHGLLGLAPDIVAAWVTPARAAADTPLMERLTAMLSSVDAHVYAACCEAIAELDISGDLPHIQAPTLVLAGGEDHGLPPVHSRLIAHAITGASYREVPAAAHLPWLEEPDAVLDAIRQHLAGSAGRVVDDTDTRRDS
jgi:pimeloyl-ACP methyl ester carboxylesterase